MAWKAGRWTAGALLALLAVGCGADNPAPLETGSGGQPGTDGGGPTGTGGGGQSNPDASDAFAATVAPTTNGNRLALNFGTTVFEVDPTVAGKIVTFSLDGTNVLVNSGDHTGSVFWPSPQNVWPGTWPPPPEFDSAAYSASTEGNVIVLSGSTTSATFGSLRATKRFWANADSGVVTIEYTIHNDGSAAASVAPWEDSRVYPGGLTFFPEASADLVSFVPRFNALPITSSQGAGWFQYQAAQITAQLKSGADGAEGWAAHVDCHATLERKCTGARSPVFIKQLPDVTRAEFAPGEAEIEIFAENMHVYVEFENQGSYGSIPAGGQRTWTVHWYLRPLPDTISSLTGNTQLLDFVRGQLR
jgi:hypothetical protein